MNIHPYIFTIILTLTLSVQFNAHAGGPRPIKMKFKNGTGVKATDLHIQFKDNNDLNIYCDPDIPGFPVQVVKPAAAFKKYNKSKAKGSTKNRLFNFKMDAAKGGVGVPAGGTVEIELFYHSACPCIDCEPPEIEKVWWTNSDKLISDGKPIADGGDRIGDYLKYDKAKQYFAMAPATGNGQLKINLDGNAYYFSSLPGEDGTASAARFVNFIETVVPFGYVLDTVADEWVDFTILNFGDSSNIDVQVLQQDLTQQILHQVEPVPMPPNHLGHQQLYPGDVMLTWETDPLAHHYVLQGVAVGSPNVIVLPVPASSNGQFPVANLPLQQQYAWSVATSYDPGGLTRSAYAHVDTFATGCEKPVSVSSFNQSPTSTQVVWTQVPGVAGYTLFFKRDGNHPIQTVAISGSANNSYALQNLVDGASYLVAVRSVCDFSGIGLNSPLSPLHQFTAGTGNSLKTAQEKIEGQDPIKIYPNPASSWASVELGASPAVIEVYDASGGLVYEATKGSEHRKEIINTSRWTSGYYHVVIRTEHSIETHQLSIVHN